MLSGAPSTYGPLEALREQCEAVLPPDLEGGKFVANSGLVVNTELRKHGLTSAQIQTAVRIAATVNAVARVMAAEV